MNTVTVKINGMEYNLKGKEDDEYLLKVSEYVDGKFKEVSSNNNKLSISSVAVLSALNIADELFKCNKEVDDLLKKKNSLEERNLTLKERIREIKQEIEETVKNKNQEMASLKEMLYLMEQKSREAEILNDKVADLTEELEEKSKLEEEVALLKEKMAALQNENEDLAREIALQDDKIDSLYNRVQEDCLRVMNANPQTINQGVNLLFIGRYLERIGDHITNICEMIIFAINGEMTEIG